MVSSVDSTCQTDSCVTATRSSWRSRYNSSECSEALTPRSIKSFKYPQELSDQLRAVRRTVFILTTPHKPCYVENLVLPHIKLLVAGNLDLALHLNTQDRGKSDNTPIERLIGSMLCLDSPEAELYTSTLMSSDLSVTDVYDTLFRWMGETKVLIETVHLRGVNDIQKLEQLHSNFQDARFIWETSDPRCCNTEEELSEWYSSNSTIQKFLSAKFKHTWVHVKQDDVINNNKNIAESVTECIGVFVSRHYDKMLKSLSKFVSKNPQPQINPDTQITDERIVKLSTDLGYYLTDDIVIEDS
ncbi:uncharacterized protein LOC134825189 isoform X2 [Bolinopsis microptera]|uniref:uncharacterized protein LOC134825189 isoform X2 n=1 Tax=Bolinopsis microptera TaxID=2820187 RepID=UPI003079ED29